MEFLCFHLGDGIFIIFPCDTLDDATAAGCKNGIYLRTWLLCKKWKYFSCEGQDGEIYLSLSR